MTFVPSTTEGVCVVKGNTPISNGTKTVSSAFYYMLYQIYVIVIAIVIARVIAVQYTINLEYSDHLHQITSIFETLSAVLHKETFF